MTAQKPFEAVTCPSCSALVVAQFPPERGWPRTAFTNCSSCGRRIVIERLQTGQFQARRHRGIFEGLLRL